jgi:hypothetical protein
MQPRTSISATVAPPPIEFDMAGSASSPSAAVPHGHPLRPHCLYKISKAQWSMHEAQPGTPSW